MKTPQVDPEWRTGIWTGRAVANGPAKPARLSRGAQEARSLIATGLVSHGRACFVAARGDRTEAEIISCEIQMAEMNG